MCEKKLLISLRFVLILLLNYLVSFGQDRGVVDYVNPLMGTDSRVELSNGNTFPAVGVPWGMNLWTPQTGPNNSGWQYQYAANKMNGFKLTHQPSPWLGDFGTLSIMPISQAEDFGIDRRSSWFSHKTEISKPYYYKVYLAKPNVWTEMTSSSRAAQFRFKYDLEGNNRYVALDGFDHLAKFEISPMEKKIVGYTTYNTGSVPKNFKNYFVIRFEENFSFHFWRKDSLINGIESMESDSLGLVLEFESKTAEINCQIATSYVSVEQAEINLEREIGQNSLEETKLRSRDEWNKQLSRVEVLDGTIDELRTFYSCLYRTILFPLSMHEINENQDTVHFSPYTGKIHGGYMFAGTGFWDTFRALYPFLTLMYPSINIKMQKGLVNVFKEGGFLPEWSAPGYRNSMIGNNSASVVAGAYLKGLRGYDIETLFDAVVKGANNEGPIDAVGRKGIGFYKNIGYIPYNVGINENAARTLEYAYDDYAIYALGKALGKPLEEIEIYAKRSQNYKNLFDSSSRLMRGKNEDGTFQSPFNPFKWGDAFTEGNSWHYTWSVFHDIKGLRELMGGREIFNKMLDSIFKLPPTYDESYYGTVIHEIREMQIAGMGQYAHGNQPIQHMLYLYNFGGEPWKGQYWIRETMNRLYKSSPDGYCGDEDNGQTSAWYVFSALGFYPVTPASTQYALGSPLFKEVRLHLENGNTFEIIAPENSLNDRYIKSIMLNNNKYERNWIDHFEILKGGNLLFEMNNIPNKERGTKEKDFPFSFSASKVN